MSHRDYINVVPDGFTVTATTAHCPVAAMANKIDIPIIPKKKIL